MKRLVQIPGSGIVKSCDQTLENTGWGDPNDKKANDAIRQWSPTQEYFIIADGNLLEGI